MTVGATKVYIRRVSLFYISFVNFVRLEKTDQNHDRMSKNNEKFPYLHQGDQGTKKYF